MRFRKKSIAKTVSDTEGMKNTPIHVCAKTAFVGWPSTESMLIASFRNFLFYNHDFRKHFKLVYTKKCGYCNFQRLYNVTCMHLGVRNFTKVVHVCAEVVRDCRKFEEHRTIAYTCRGWNGYIQQNSHASVSAREGFQIQQRLRSRTEVIWIDDSLLDTAPCSLV
jgi:hypothetical protein